MGVGVEEAVSRLDSLKLVPHDAVRGGAEQGSMDGPLHDLGPDSIGKILSHRYSLKYGLSIG